MITITQPEDFFTTYLKNLDKSVDTLRNLLDYIRHTGAFSDDILPFVNRIFGDVDTVMREVDQSAATLRTIIAHSKGVSPVTGNPLPHNPNVPPPVASGPSSVANTIASTTPTVAGGTPNAKNNNSIFLWALAAIGGIGLFAALNTGKRK